MVRMVIGFKYERFSDDSKTGIRQIPQYQPFFTNYLGELSGHKGIFASRLTTIVFIMILLHSQTDCFNIC